MSAAVASIKTEREESPVAPDSTTVDKISFSEGEDVLILKEDNLYYYGTIVQVDPSEDKCRVLFGDDTECWSHFQDLKKVGVQDEVDPLCTACKQNQTTSNDEVIVCHHCYRGFHQNCHKPPICQSSTDVGNHWTCSSCISENFPVSIEKDSPKQTTLRTYRGPSARRTGRVKSFPYDICSLHWDTYHRRNAEHRYCYCGKGGDWYRRMLQCCRCLQWFHELCVRKLQHPLLFGDRFYLFLCSVCNSGRDERVTRLSETITMTDLVHLILYNLALETGRQYHHLDTGIIPFMEQRWKILQLPDEIYSLNGEERRNEILDALWNCRSRFFCSREAKNSQLWALRTRVPPPLPANHSSLVAQYLATWTNEDNAAAQYKLVSITKRPRKPDSNGALETSLDSTMRTLRARPRTSISTPVTPAETSGDELSSSRGGGGSSSLDLYIPHLNDFDGSNNPFVNLDESGVRNGNGLKRVRLSAKDIRVTKDGQIRRRRFTKRKPGSDAAAMSLFSPITPLKVLAYFGSRIQQGKEKEGNKLSVQAKRILPSGKVEILLEEL